MYILLSNFLIFCFRKWTRLCVSYDFQKNQAQVAFGGKVSDLIVDPETRPNMNGRFDNNIITAANTSEMIVIVGRYPFDKNPFIGIIAGINLWSRWELISLLTLLIMIVIGKDNV